MGKQAPVTGAVLTIGKRGMWGMAANGGNGPENNLRTVVAAKFMQIRSAQRGTVAENMVSRGTFWKFGFRIPQLAFAYQSLCWKRDAVSI